MSMSFDFHPDDLLRALRGEVVETVEEEVGASEELRSVARRIAGNHVDVVAGYARAALTGEPSGADRHQLATALSSLARLAEAADDQRQHQVLVEMKARLKAPPGRRRQARRELRAWIEQFASCLEGDDAARLRELVRHQPDAQPLLAELAHLRGIGPRRLERLYASGLYTVEVVACAAPEEVTAVSGLPATLADRVVRAARAYAARRREVCVDEIRGRVLELERMLAVLQEPLSPSMKQDLRASLDGLRTMLQAPEEER